MKFKLRISYVVFAIIITGGGLAAIFLGNNFQTASVRDATDGEPVPSSCPLMHDKKCSRDGIGYGYDEGTARNKAIEACEHNGMCQLTQGLENTRNEDVCHSVTHCLFSSISYTEKCAVVEPCIQFETSPPSYQCTAVGIEDIDAYKCEMWTPPTPPPH